MAKQVLKKRKTSSKSTTGSKGKPKRSDFAKDDVIVEKLVKGIHKDLVANPPPFVTDGFKMVENKLKDFSNSVKTLQEEDDALKIEVLKQMDYCSQTNMRILELLSLQNNYFATHLNRIHIPVYYPTVRRNTSLVIQGTSVLPNT